MNENIRKNRWSKDQVRTMLLDQSQSFWERDTGIPRSRLEAVERAADLHHAVIISGLRRVGKSTLLAQLAHRLGKDAYYYLNFEDDRLLGFQASDAQDLHLALLELFGGRRIFLLDEIQNVPDWEHFVRRFIDMGFKFYITGSNASLLSREFGARLTGRYVPVELFPFSFAEYLRFRGIELPDLTRLTSTAAGLLQQQLSDYLHLGGIPDPLKYPELPLLRQLYEGVLYRDIATRYGIRKTRPLKELAFYLMSNPASLVSFNKLKEQLHLGSVNTVTSYIEYLQNSWLLFTTTAYDYSVKRQQIAPKKIYPIDTGLASAVGFNLSANTGKLLETAVFLALRRRTTEIYYYTTPSGYEVDFFLPESQQLIQVAQNLAAPSTRGRELRALTEARKALGEVQALILSDTNGEVKTEQGASIEVRSLAEWLLEKE